MGGSETGEEGEGKYAEGLFVHRAMVGEGASGLGPARWRRTVGSGGRGLLRAGAETGGPSQ